MTEYTSEQGQRTLAAGQAVLMSVCLALTVVSLIVVLVMALQQRTLTTQLVHRASIDATAALALAPDPTTIDLSICGTGEEVPDSIVVDANDQLTTAPDCNTYILDNAPIAP